MLILLALLFMAAVCAPIIVAWLGRNALFLLAAAPGAVAVWAAFQTPRVFSAPLEQSFQWVPSLDLQIVLRLDVLSWLMLLIVGGVGALVLVYSARYFSAEAPGLGRFASLFLAFSGAMMGVVMADQTMTLYLFWELTSILSYLLIGFHHGRRPARSAARQALLVTGMTALAMFGGFVMLGEAPGGSYRISELISALQSGTLDAHSPLVITAALLILSGALAKSAQVPFHFWLPGAMAAPTPVSAYLHAAAMVKAGVYLIARLTPGFTLIPGWSALAVTIGLLTMVIGAYRALRQRDLKLVLAYGTVSQLGLMTAAVGFGSAETMAAGIVILLAHSLFKSALFLTVGTVESATGTRDLWELSGLWKKMPLLAGFAALAALSMAGVPITTGYLGKEGLIAALAGGTEAPWTQSFAGLPPEFASWAALIVVAAGSMLTAAYAWRLWWGAFATKHVSVSVTVKPVGTPMLLPVVVLATGSLLGLAAGPLQSVTASISNGLSGHAHIALWSGLLPAAITLVILAGGVTLAVFRPTVFRLQRSIRVPFSAVRAYSWCLRELEVLASSVTALMQRGSLPGELGTIFAAVIAVSAWALISAPNPQASPVAWDSLTQLGIVIVGVIAVIITAASRHRIKAALSLGAVGMIVSLLFAQYGAPDLALTQLAVEAVSVVVFILVLRKLPTWFSSRPLISSRLVRMLIAIGVGLSVSVGGYFAIASRIADPVSVDMPSEALNFGYGKNIVNVILVDIRAWDTVGELSVLLVTATGVASLIYIMSRTGKISRVEKPLEPNQFLAGARALAHSERSVVLEVSTRLLFPTMIILSLWLLAVGHDNPGGGFAGGVVAGLAFALRYLAGGRYELGEAMPIPAGYLLGGGLFIAAAGGALPLLYGNAVLQSVPIDIGMGPIGILHFTSAMILDFGVYILVIGLIIDLISALGAEIDRQSTRSEQGRSPVPAERSVKKSEPGAEVFR